MDPNRRVTLSRLRVAVLAAVGAGVGPHAVRDAVESTLRFAEHADDPQPASGRRLRVVGKR